MPDMDKIIT